MPPALARGLGHGSAPWMSWQLTRLSGPAAASMCAPRPQSSPAVFSPGLWQWVRIWSSTAASCAAGSHMTASGNDNAWADPSTAPECTSDGESVAFRCCADEEVYAVC